MLATMMMMTLLAPEQGKAKAKPADNAKLVSVAKLDTVEILVQGYVSNGVIFSDWKQDKGTLTATAQHKSGSKYTIKVDAYDKEGIRVGSLTLSASDLVTGEKSRIVWKIKREWATIKITRDLSP